MEPVSFLRHNAFFGPEDVQGKTLNIIGVGATGSWVGLIAAKMGWHRFKVWDADVVESHNCPNQIYDANQIGMKKVDAFEQRLKQVNPLVLVEKHDYFFDGEKHGASLQDYVFIGVDTLSARKDILSCIKDNLFINMVAETKMGFSHAELNIIDPADEDVIDKMISLLKDDSEVKESPCNERIITTLTNVVASTAVHSFCDIASLQRRNKTYIKPYKLIFSLDNFLTTFPLGV